MSESPRLEDMEAAAKVVFEADAAQAIHRAAATFYEGAPRRSATRTQDTPEYIATAVHESEVDASNVATPPVPFAQASPVEASASIQVETFERRLDLMTEMLIDIRRESLTSISAERDSPRFNVPLPSSPSPSRSDSQARSTRTNLAVNSDDLESYVQERLSPVFARRRSSIKDYLGSLAQEKDRDSPKVCKNKHHPAAKAVASFPNVISRMSFSKESEKSETQRTPKESPRCAVKAKVTEVLDAIHSSPRSSPTPPSGQVTSKEALELELDALSSPQPAISHSVSEHEDPDLLLRNVDAAVASFQQTVVQAKVYLTKSEGDEAQARYQWYGNYSLYMSCLALGAGIVVGLKGSLMSKSYK